MSRLAAICFLCCTLITGCGAPSDSLTTENPSGSGQGMVNGANSSLVLVSMPAGEITSPTDIKELGGEAATTVLAGRIDAGDMDPFQPGEVAFMISQLPDEGHGSDDPDHADNCPFCKHRLANAPKAIIQFHAADGSVLSGNARRALSLEKGDVVYITGSAQFNPAVNTVMMSATGVFKK